MDHVFGLDAIYFLEGELMRINYPVKFRSFVLRDSLCLTLNQNSLFFHADCATKLIRHPRDTRALKLDRVAFHLPHTWWGGEQSEQKEVLETGYSIKTMERRSLGSSEFVVPLTEKHQGKRYSNDGIFMFFCSPPVIPPFAVHSNSCTLFISHRDWPWLDLRWVGLAFCVQKTET